MTSIPDPGKRIAIAFYEAFGACDLAAFDRILAPGWVNHPADPGHAGDRAGFTSAIAETHAALEGFRLVREALVAEGDLVVCRITMTGRHVAALGDWKPSGRMTTIHGMDMHRIEAGRIAETWHFERLGEP